MMMRMHQFQVVRRGEGFELRILLVEGGCYGCFRLFGVRSTKAKALVSFPRLNGKTMVLIKVTTVDMSCQGRVIKPGRRRQYHPLHTLMMVRVDRDSCMGPIQAVMVLNLCRHLFLLRLLKC